MSEDMRFEDAMARLEEVVMKLEKGDVPLEEAIQLFAEGTRLAHLCKQKLDWAQQKIEMLVKENGEWVKKPFQTEEEL